MSETDDGLTAADLTRRPHCYRDHEPADYWEAAEASGKPDTREALRRVEGGRFYPMLKATHTMYCALDPDERDMFWRGNPDLMRWVSVWGYLEDLTDCTHHKPDDV